MLFLDILFLLGFCLVFARADGKNIFDDAGEKTETFGDDPVFLDEGVDISAEAASMEDAPKEEVRRQIVRPPFVRRVTIPISVPGNTNSVFFRTCYCYRRICYVKGMYQGFKGWMTLYQSGYVVIGDYLYKFYRCDPKPLPTKPLPTKSQ